MNAIIRICLPAALILFFSAAQAFAGDTYSKQEIKENVEGFFQSGASGIGEAVEKVFSELGEPTGYITGNEGGGAVIVGLRYGEGVLHLKGKGRRKVFWQGPSAGFDFGGNVAKVCMLVYGLKDFKGIYHRFPGVDGSGYVVGGVGLNYNRWGDVTVAPMRTGVGLRLGINAGYIHFTPEQEINPF